MAYQHDKQHKDDKRIQKKLEAISSKISKFMDVEFRNLEHSEKCKLNDVQGLLIGIINRRGN